MNYIVIALLGFLIIHAFDLVSIKRVPVFKPVLWLLGCGALVYALAGIMLAPEKFFLPLWAVWLGWVIFGVSGLLLLYSLFIKLDFRATYISTGVGNNLVKSGMYALVRHPGVIWFVLVIISLMLISRSVLFFIAAPLLISADIALVIVQDRILFVRMFSGYRDYQQETPMLLPNRSSFQNFIKSLKNMRENTAGNYKNGN